MAGPFAFDKNAQDGDVVTLENGVTYQYDEAKDRWLVKDVAGSGSGIEYATLEHSDGRDDHLQTQIDELEQELDVIAPRLEAAQYTYSDSPAVKAGEMHVMSGSFTAGTDVILFNDVALDGNTHTWAELQVGDYLEITDTLETRTAANYAMYLVSKAPEGTGLKQIDVTLVKGQGVPTAGDVMDAKGFQLGGNDINDLDDRYALKSHSHDARDITSGTISMSRLPTGTSSTSVAVGNHSHDGVYAPDDHTHSEYALKEHTHEGAEGGYIVTPLVFPNLSGSQYASDDSIKSLNQYGSPTNGDFQGLDIPWLWFEKHYPDIIGWVDDGGDAKWGDQRGSLSVNKDSSNRPGLTISGNWSYSRVTVTIPGFVIHVDKMEEPQWGHKWPEKE